MTLPQKSALSDGLISKPKHEYMPIDPKTEIRLLTLHTADPTDPELVSCQLENVLLDSKVEYTALSYTWGDTTNRKPIICNGSRLHVTVNLFNALRELRYINRNVRLWIDAISINQEDNKEKSVQVGKMSDIYKKAQKVWVWLGEKSEGTSRAYRLAEELHTHFDLDNVDEKYFQTVLEPLGVQLDSRPDLKNNHIIAASAAMLKVEDALSINSQAPGDISDWEALSQLFALSWFERKWIIQEIVLAREAHVFCGTQSIQWQRLKRVSEILPSCVANMILRNEPAGLPFPILLSGLNRTPLSATIAKTSAGESMLSLLISTSQFKCSNAVDRYFALHSLAAEAKEPKWPLDPDYDLELREVSFRFGKWNLVTKSNPTILEFVETNQPPEKSRSPSWVPSFNSDGGDSFIGNDPQNSIWQCSGNRVLDVQVSDTEFTLHIKGQSLGVIARVEADDSIAKAQALQLWSTIPSLNNGSLTLLSLFNPSSYRDKDSIAMANQSLIQLLQPAIRFRNMLHDLIGAVHEFHTETSRKMRIALFEALTFDLFDEKAKPSHECSQTFLDVLKEIIASRPRPEAELRKLMQDLKFHALYEALLSHSRRYCATANDLIAVVPRVSSIGDRICLFYGCQIPFVIRPAGDGKYYLVGPCYLHGMMNGEGLRNDQDTERFVLR